MKDPHYSIDELAEATGLTRRTLRFYVQQGLLPPPHGAGRGSYYDDRHRQQLDKLQRWQEAGRSLDEIRRILSGEGEGAKTPSAPSRRPVPVSCWQRLPLEPGLELHLDTTRPLPSAEQIDALRAAIQSILGGPR